jgi:hypothetical protein
VVQDIACDFEYWEGALGSIVANEDLSAHYSRVLKSFCVNVHWSVSLNAVNIRNFLSTQVIVRGYLGRTMQAMRSCVPSRLSYSIRLVSAACWL